MESFLLFFMMDTALFCLVICVACVIPYVLSPVEQATTRQEDSLTRVMSHRQIANFTAMDPKGLGDKLILRARPNARLAKTFRGLNNSFTTTDIVTHQIFVRQARSAIQIVSTEEWIRIGNGAATILERTIDHFDAEAPYLPLASLIRIVSFSVMLKVFFDVDLCTVDLEVVLNATEAISRLWIHAKDKHAEPSPYVRKVLDNALRKLLPSQYAAGDRHDTPLDLLIPGYKTLDRVVLLTFLDTAYRHRDAWTRLLVCAAVASVPQCFGQSGDNDAELRARMIAKEGLRLYPPTKRMHRSASVVSKDDRAIVAADVEACHRDPDIWGADAHEFKPARFRDWPDGPSPDTAVLKKLGSAATPDLSPAELRSLAYMPFSIGKHQCPAAGGFGERIITLLVVKLIQRFGTRETGLRVHFGDSGLQGESATLLPSGRADAERWVLEMEAKNRRQTKSG